MGWFKEGFMAGLLGDGYWGYKTRQAVRDQTVYLIERDRATARATAYSRLETRFYQQVMPLSTQLDVAVDRVVAAFNDRHAMRTLEALRETELIAAPMEAALLPLVHDSFEAGATTEWTSMLLRWERACVGWRSASHAWQEARQLGGPPPWDAVRLANEHWVGLADRMAGLL